MWCGCVGIIYQLRGSYMWDDVDMSSYYRNLVLCGMSVSHVYCGLLCCLSIKEEHICGVGVWV